jgi:gliding motility-associated-like protein
MLSKIFLRTIFPTLFLALFVVGTPISGQLTVLWEGADFSYRCTGNGYIEYNLVLRRMCNDDGTQGPFDPTTQIFVYDLETGDEIINFYNSGKYILRADPSDTLNAILQDDCKFIEPNKCYSQLHYQGEFKLPYRESGYMLGYFRCCRNEVANILDADTTGFAVTIQIDKEAQLSCNASPTWDAWQDYYVCAGESIEFDHSATDADGDSLVYSMYHPYGGGGPDEFDWLPYHHPDWPFPLVEWAPGYSEFDVFGNPSDPLQIDAETGLLTGTPLTNGRYTVGIQVQEYRNGVLLSTVQRDMQINVVACRDVAEASFNAPDIFCEGFTVDFENTSHGLTYVWYFDYINNPGWTSTEENPSYTYPGVGQYEIALVATLDDICYDTAYHTLNIFVTDMVADFEIATENCDEIPILVSFNDLSTGTISTWDWVITTADSVYNVSGQNQTVSIAEPGTVSGILTITDFQGCVRTFELSADIQDFELNLEGNGYPIDICSNESTPLILNGDPALTYTVSPTTNVDFTIPHNPIASPDVTTTYIITVTDGICLLTDSVLVEVTQTDLEIEWVANPIEMCLYEETQLILNGNPDWTYNWSPTDNLDLTEPWNPIATPDVTTIYYVTVTDENGCTLEDSNEVIVNPNPLTLTPAANPIEICEEGSTHLISDGNPNWTYTWDPVSDLDLTLNYDPIASPDVTTTYSVTVTNDTCYLIGEIVVVVGDFSPDVEYNIEEVECSYTKIITITEPANAEILWSDENNEEIGTGSVLTIDIYNPQTINVYVLDLESQCDTTFAIPLDLNVHLPPITTAIPDLVTLCFDGSVEMNPNGDPQYVYSWTPAGIFDDPTSYNPSATVTEDMTVYVTVSEDGNPDCFTLDTVDINYVEPFDITTTDDTAYCNVRIVTLTATATAADYEVFWYLNGELVGTGNDLVYEADATTTFDVEFVTEGCIMAGTSTVTYIDELYPFIEISATWDNNIHPDTIIPGITIQFDVINGMSNYNYVWTPANVLTNANIQNPEGNPTTTTTFIVTVTDENGCESQDDYTITVADSDCAPPFVYLPNSFTPNGDNMNDELHVRGIGFQDIHLRILNRWGELVFETQDQADGWDGTHNGEELAPAVYGYILDVTCWDGEKYNGQGNVTLIR